jgi:hypothetical protein
MKRSKANPATMKAFIVSLAEGAVRLEDPYTSRDVDEAIRIAKELGTVVPTTRKQPAASEPTASHFPLSGLWKIYAAEQTAVDGWTAKTVVDMYGPVKRYQGWCEKNARDPYDKGTAAAYKADSLLKDSTSRGTRLKPETVNQHIDRLSAMFRWAIDNGKASIDPFHKLKVRIGAKTRAAKGKPRPP